MARPKAGDPAALCPRTGNLSVDDLYQHSPPRDALGGGEGPLVPVYTGSVLVGSAEGHHQFPEPWGPIRGSGDGLRRSRWSGVQVEADWALDYAKNRAGRLHGEEES